MEIVVSRAQIDTLLRVVVLGEWMVNAYRPPAECVRRFQQPCHVAPENKTRTGSPVLVGMATADGLLQVISR
jgi:hypothetical protein